MFVPIPKYRLIWFQFLIFDFVLFVDQNDDEEETKEEKSFAESEAVEQDEG